VKDISELQAEDEGNGSFLEDLDFIKLLIVAKENFLFIFLLVSISFLGAYLYNRYTPGVYESISVIKMDTPKEKLPMGLAAMGTSTLQPSNDLPGEIELIQSPLLHEIALKLLNFDVFYYQHGNLRSTEVYGTAPFYVQYQLKNESFYDQQFDLRIKNNKTFVISYVKDGEEKEISGQFGKKLENNDFVFDIKLHRFVNSLEGNYFFIINSKTKLMSYISQNLSVAILNQAANTLQLSFKDNTSAKARDVLIAIDSVYKVESIKRKYQSQLQTITFLNDQLKLTEGFLQDYEARITNFKIQNNLIYKSQEDKAQTKIIDEESITEKANALKKQITVLDKIKGILQRNENLSKHLATLNLLSDSDLEGLLLQLKKAQDERERLLATVKPTSFSMKRKDKEVEDLKTSLFDIFTEKKNILKEEYHYLQSKLVYKKSTFMQEPTKEMELNRLNRFYNLYEKYYLMIIDKKAEFEMTMAGAVAEFVVLTQPTLSNVPISPKKMTAYFFGGGGALLFAIIFVLYKYMTHNTINNVGELERSIIAPVLGFIPVLPKSMDVSRLVVDKNPKSHVIESLRSIRTNLEFLAPEKKKKLISVTSTISGEGKTFVAINLGGVIAYSGTKVIIVDMDLRKPKINQGFGVDNDKGVSTILIGKHRVEDCIHRSTIDTLDFITSGPTPPNPSELLLKPEFDQMIDYLKSRYDVVIIDTPPVGLVTDGILVMRKVDLPIYVVRSEYSKKGFEKNINKLVRNHGFKNISVILNAFNNVLSGYGYGYQYGYGYGYGYYSEQDKEEETFFSKVMEFFKRKK